MTCFTPPSLPRPGSLRRVLTFGLATACAAVGLSAPAEAQVHVSNNRYVDRLAEVDFNLHHGELTGTQPYAFFVEVLGTAITYKKTRLPVFADLNLAGGKIYPWKHASLYNGSNLNDGGKKPLYVHPELVAANTPLTVKAVSYIKQGRYWNLLMTANTAHRSPQVIVLKNGDPAPQIGGFDGQADASSYVSDYIENGRMKLHVNQAIYLFELGTDKLNSSSADFQDLVVMVTLAESVEAIEEAIKGEPVDFD